MILSCVLILILFKGLLGMKQGLINIAVSFVSLVITILVAGIFAPVLSSVIVKHTKYDDKLANSTYEMIINNESITSMLRGSDEIIIMDDTTVLSEYVEGISAILEQIGDSLKLPKSFVHSISDIKPKNIEDNAKKYSGSSVMEIIVRIFSERISFIIIKALAYVIIILVFYIILRIVIFATGIVKKIPVIKQINKLGGFVIGVFEGLIVVWMFFAIITILGSNELSAAWLEEINGNGFLRFLYNNNLIMKLVFKNI